MLRGASFNPAAPSAIGGSTPAAGTFTTLNAIGAATLDGDVKVGNATTDLVGFHGIAAVDQGAALTAQLTLITHSAPGTPDYAIQNLVQNTGFGFATADEGNTVLSVILNLQTRVAEVEQRLEEKGLVAAN